MSTGKGKAKGGAPTVSATVTFTCQALGTRRHCSFHRGIQGERHVSSTCGRNCRSGDRVQGPRGLFEGGRGQLCAEGPCEKQLQRRKTGLGQRIADTHARNWEQRCTGHVRAEAGDLHGGGRSPCALEAVLQSGGSHPRAWTALKLGSNGEM